MSETKDISTAPKDGTRVLVRTPCFRWSSDICQHVAVGNRWVEARFCAGIGGSEPAWHEWRGDEKTFSTDWIVAEAWMPLPKPPSALSTHSEGKDEEGVERAAALEEAAKICDSASNNLVVGELPHGVCVGLAAAIRALKTGGANG